MKRLIEFTGIIMAIALVMTVIYHLVNTIPPAGTSKESQAIAIFEDASCMTCHQKDVTAPFYTNLPLIGQIMNKDIKNGYQMFNMEDAWNKIKQEEAINETHLTQIEMATIIRKTMPPAKHYLTHWGASVTPAKQTILKNWIKYHRGKFYPNHLSVEQFKYDPVRPIPSLTVNKRKAILGKELFHDTRLSSDNTISCASCHNLKTGGANNRQYAKSVNNRLGSINTPTIYNTYFDNIHAWSGDAISMEKYLEKHITDPAIMGNVSFIDIIRKLQKKDDIKNTFNKLYDNGITISAITDAITEYGKTLLTPDCSFDKYLKGDEYAINKKELFGYELFKFHKCATCHTGINIGGQTCELMGRYENYFSDRGWELSEEDMGHFNHTINEYDRHRFKVPGLRNVALTKPYFHDGSRQTLTDAVKTMGVYQSDSKLNNEEISAIVAFLESLTGEAEK